MGRKFVFERPKMTSITIDVLTAEIIRQYKYTGEPLYRTVNRIMRDHAPPDLVEKCKAKLDEMQKNALARIDRYGQTRQASLTNEDESDKPSENYPQEWRGVPKSDYIDALAIQTKSPRKFAKAEVQRRIKEGVLLEHAGFVEEVKA
jgi:hypothetical protein